MLTALALALAPLFGAPTVCQPWDIGDAKTLPMPESSAAAALAPGVLAAETVRLLDTSDDALVHMETLRRSMLLFASAEDCSHRCCKDACSPAGPDSFGEGGGCEEHADSCGPGATACLDGLLAVLAERRQAAVTAGGRKEALAAFDLALAEATARTACGRESKLSITDLLARATELAPNDAALQFGAAIALMDTRQKDAWKAFDRVLALQPATDGLVHRNLMAVAQRYFEEPTHDAFVARVRRELGGC